MALLDGAAHGRTEEGDTVGMNNRNTIIDVLREIASDKWMLNHADYWALICGEAADLLETDAFTLLKGQGWISVKDRMPAETHSLFWPWYGKKKWSNAMWREQSDKVLVAVAFNDGTRFVTTGETHDGKWHTSISRTLNPVVTHWRQMPEPPKEGR